MNINKNRYPKEYYLLELKTVLNKELFENSIISYELFDEMQKLIIKKMNLIVDGSKADNYECCES